MGKTVSAFLEEELKEAACPLQVCAGHSAGAKAAIHVLTEVFTEQETNGILLIDASNAFNIMNRFATLHSIQITVQEISLCLSKWLIMLCIQGGGEVLSQEGTIRGDPLAMPWYSVNTSILINSLRMGSPTLRHVWFTDDSAGTGRIKALYDLYKYPLSKEWVKYGYHVIGLQKLVNWLSHRNWCLKLNWILETITAAHVRAIIEQSMPSPEPPEDMKKQSLTAANPRSKMMDYLPDLLPYVNQARDKGASSWLTSLPLQEQGLALSKQ